ncbi:MULTISPECIES: hypothetical protein [Staphylococcus]|uniref:Permease n=1 Tax=Staphylococcus hsinchuensis TaxID=3051183 RepID=A0ABZ3EC63_9STAP|nr:MULTISPECIES: hypothetical protein [unclassified Staphylococcus]
MTLTDLPHYLWITVIAVILLTVFNTLVLHKWFATPIITFLILTIAAFFIPIFYDISYKPLFGYAMFMSIISIIISFLIWFFTRNWRRQREQKRIEKVIRKHHHYYGQNHYPRNDFNHHYRY